MKYAAEVIDLLACYPERSFKMRHVLNHIAPGASPADLPALRVAAWRALLALEESGQVEIIRPVVNGGSASYRWKTITSDAGEPFQKPSQYVRATAP